MIESAGEFARLRGSKDPMEYERAGRDSAPLRVWLEVIDGYRDLRQWVAYNKTVPVSILELLAKDADPKVRWMVAMRRAAPAHVLEALAEDADESVRARVAYNKRAPLDAVRRLLEDDSWVVRSAAKSAMERFSEDEQAIPGTGDEGQE